MDDLSAVAKRYYMDCDCVIWVYGRTPQGHQVPRQSTGVRDLVAAEAQCKIIIAKSNAIAREEAAKAKTDPGHGPTILQCGQLYLASRRSELKDKTYGQHELLLNRLAEYCAKQGIQHASGLTVDLLERFKVEGLPKGMADTSKSTAVAKLRCFLRTAYRRGWLNEPLVEKVTSHHAVYEQKQPYTEDEIVLIMDEALKLKGGTARYARHPKTFRLMLELMLEAGLRVSDALLYDPRACVIGEVLWVYTFVPQKQQKKKKPKPMDAFLSNRLKKAIDECEWLSPHRPFAYGNYQNERWVNYLGNEVYERMKIIGSRCGVADCRPHRLRDTFAVRCLLDGTQSDDLRALLGHSSVKVTEAHYAPWIQARKARLERLRAQTLRTHPLVDPESNALGNAD
jgi:integrase